MKTLYVECKMGVAGDMLSAALLELCDNREEMLEKLSQIGIPGVTYSLIKSEKCGITGSHLEVKVNGEEEISEDVHEHHHGHDHEHGHHHGHEDGDDHEYEHHHGHGHEHHPVHEDEYDQEHHHSHDYEYVHDHNHEDNNEHEHNHEHHHEHVHVHRNLKDIEDIVNSLNLNDAVKNDVINVYKLIAEAESTVHGMPVSEIHFHEVGSLDAVADISAACMIMNEIHPEKVVVSPIHVGSGQVKCAHGILPVPAPATAFLLKGIPSYSGDVKGELCTPTGAALVKYFADEFGPQPVMSISKIGYGMGKKDFKQANCVRVMLDEGIDCAKTDATNSKAKTTNTEAIRPEQNLAQPDDSDAVDNSTPTDEIIELVCNLDDMTPEAIGFATERLMDEGAADVFTTPIGMKKNRPGIMLTVLCKENIKDSIVRSIFKYTTTIGIRESICKRYILNRKEKTFQTPDGEIRVKEVSGYGVKRQKKEYEDLARIAREKGSGLRK